MIDSLSILTAAEYVDASDSGLFTERYGYDLNGNMTSRTKAVQLTDSSGNTTPANLVARNSYTGNRMRPMPMETVTYDACGRLTGESSGKVRSIRYNEIGLPQEMTLSDGSTVNVVYAADGRKLREKVTSGSTSVIRNYSGNCIFEGSVLKKVLFEGGYIQMSGNTPTYLFFLIDHLGSVRVVADENGSVRQVNQYYPYGDLIEDANMIEWMSDNRYRFTGKELATETGLYDFCARYLETSMGRFTTIDPLAEKYPSVSPYAYCAGDPVNRVDPDGRTDYFNNDGEFLYNDGRDNGMIKISTSEQIEELKNQLEASNISSVQRKNILISFSNNSAKFSERILDMSDDAIISVYNHYNYTGLELVENNNLLNKNFAFNKRTQNIEVNVALNKTNKGLNSNSYDIINAINEHEGMHYEDYKESKLEGHNEAYWEIRAIEHQMASPSWSRASEGYRKAIESYLEEWKLKGPQ